MHWFADDRCTYTYENTVYNKGIYIIALAVEFSTKHTLQNFPSTITLLYRAAVLHHL